MWNEIHTEDEIKNLMKLYGGFHDACLKEIRYISGAHVGDNLAMNPFNNIRTVDVIFQRQYRNPTVIVMRFIGLDVLHLCPQKENYTCDIHNVMMFFKDGLIYWVDGWVTESQVEEYGGTWICAEKIQWRVIDECIGDSIVFGGIME